MYPSDRNLSWPGSGSDFRLAFEVLDADRDGKISREDLKRLCSEFSNGFAADDETIETMISLADSNGDGFVEYEEFERVLGASSSKSKRKASGVGVMEDVFKVMDMDGDGILSHDDLKRFLNCTGFSSVSDEDIKAMITLGGRDEKGISFDGLLKVLGVDFAG